jgi:hypothetical protein
VPKELALKTAHLLALNKAKEKSGDERLKGEYQRLIAQTEREMEELKGKKPTP